MTRKLADWASGHGQLTKVGPSDGCGRDAVPLAVGRRYDIPEFGGYLGNVWLPRADRLSLTDPIPYLRYSGAKRDKARRRINNGKGL